MSVHDLAAAMMRHLPAEMAHNGAVLALRAGLGPVQGAADDALLRTRIGTLELPNPVGLAAGFDKNARVGAAMGRAGFGWVECGTVTPLAQAGQARPRLFRLACDQAIINRMGFNNAGLAAFRHHFAAQKAKSGVPLGANIGANRDSADRIGDYVAGLEALWGLPDWFTINVSSPNTPGLRDLQEGAALDALLERLMAAHARLAQGGASAPVFLKLAPDLRDDAIAPVVATACRHGVTGLIIANTTLARPACLHSRMRAQAGGLSGRPLFDRSTELLRGFAEAGEGRLVLIGVGGIASGTDVFAKLRAGASAVQLYTALAFQGPALVQRIKHELATILRANKLKSIENISSYRRPERPRSSAG